MTNSEKVIAYLEGSLSENEVSAFETQLESSTELRKELDFQNEVIEGIKVARKAELKAIMNQVVVTNQWYNHQVFQGFIGAVAVGIVGFTLYTFWPAQSSTETLLPEREVTLNTDLDETIVDKQTTVKDTEDIQTADQTESPEVIETLPANKTKTEQAESSEAVDITIATPDPLGNLESADETDIIIPSQEESQVEEGSGPAIDIIKDDRKHQFHYKFTNGNLILYGNFDKTYEILDFQLSNERNMYLYYDAKYYSLESSRKEITELAEIKDATIIRQLENLRK